MTEGHWSARLHSATSTVAWCAALNALWLVFTLLGGVVFGIGPATVAACVLARRRTLGESIQARDFAVIWWREVLRGSVVILPVVFVILALWSNYSFFSALGPDASAVRLVTLVACVLAIAVGCYVGPLYAHYQLPLWSYFFHASRVALARPASTVLLLAIFATAAFITAAAPVLLLFISIGAWLHTNTWLCVRFFEENERRLADPNIGPATTGPPRAPLALPTQPLRIR
ncbi:DUF624 domain-containing protein [Natronosporangium hydrolyticum]|uniref:DUF624 domain-containing protein n=1 Tax=Natronosporangium hydrolyticum TaxID=2811111 RepID=A0A895YE13_9ACTN|nr:DUF624 domain-containing protein [Natronosporangium hydrolyticum]QSB15821.1 DUF624 domain-containing protein [Natronosporangium hydrolyticum]